MDTGGDAVDIQQLRHLAMLEQQRAARAAAIAERHEQRLGEPDGRDPLADRDPQRAHHQRMAALNRSLQDRHLAAARAHSSHADRLARWRDATGAGVGRPLFLSTVAELLQASGVAVTLFDDQQTEAVRAVSNPTAGAALDLEYTLGEGPGRDAYTEHRTVAASHDEFAARWPRYGPALERLGIHTVAATPVRHDHRDVGSFTVFDPPGGQPPDDLASILLASDPDIGLSLLAEADLQPVIHQAAGMTAAQCGCDVQDALALIRAHAFAADTSPSTVAAEIINRQLRLDR